MEALQLPFFQRALVAGLLASVACGVVGSYVVVKDMPAISGGLAHAAFGGLGLGYFLGFDPMLGAAGFGVASGLGIGVAYRRLRHGLDTLVMMVWSVGMATGIVLVAAVPGYAPDLTSYLFGNILFASPAYLWAGAALDAVLLLAVGAFFRELQAVAFDEEFAEVAGVPVDAAILVLLALTSLVVVLLIRVVGVLLVVALLTIPAAVARQWARALGRMMVLATGLCALFVTAGLFVSYGLSATWELDLPAGPVVVLLAGAGFALSSWIRSRRPGGRGLAAAGGGGGRRA